MFPFLIRCGIFIKNGDKEMFHFKNTTKEKIDEYRNKNEINMFEYTDGSVCSGDNYVMQTFQIEDDGCKIVAFCTVTCEDEQITIDEFEVLKSLRGKMVGKNIISQIQGQFTKIELYPSNSEAKLFWERCGFAGSYEDDGVIIMRWEKS